MFFSFIKNNGTDRNTLTSDIVNFRQVIFNDGRFVTVSREVRLLNSLYLWLPCLNCRMQWRIQERGPGGGGEGKVEGGITLILDQRAANFFSLKSKFAKSKTFMGKQNNIVEKNVLRKINLVSCHGQEPMGSCHGWIDCKLLTLATRYACCYKVSSVISGLQTGKVIPIETKTLKWKYLEHGEIVFSSSELPRIIRKKRRGVFLL